MALESAPVVGNIPVQDLDRAKKFYEETLGLKQVMKDEAGGLGFEAGKGTMLYLYKRGPAHAEHTLASFMVDDIENAMSDLKEKGVTFEEYDLPDMGIKTVNGLATMGSMKAAWFKDTEGNILSLGQM